MPDIKIEGPDGAFGAYVAKPKAAKASAVLVIQEIFGVNKVMRDLKTTLERNRGMPECSGRVGSVGYCLDGKLAYLMATRSSADGNVSYYGVGIEGALNEAKSIAKPYLCHIAAKDKFVPHAAQTQIVATLKGNAKVTTHVYAGCDHAFARIGGEHYDAAATKLANQRTADFFKTHLGARITP